MHACLEVQEILHYIFTLVFHDASGRPARRDLLSLALTCHYLAETALDILWHTQSNMVPLIKTLPGRCWKEDPASGFDRMFVSLSYSFCIMPFLEQVVVTHSESPHGRRLRETSILRKTRSKNQLSTLPLPHVTSQVRSPQPGSSSIVTEPNGRVQSPS